MHTEIGPKVAGFVHLALDFRLLNKIYNLIMNELYSNSINLYHFECAKKDSFVQFNLFFCLSEAY